MDTVDVTASDRRPSRTLTFLFTDIEGSTLRWERDPAAMQAALERHDELVRRAITDHGGRVFKTIGDAFCATFDRAQDGIEAALAGQAALARADFSGVDGIAVRVALHSGSAAERDGDYFGPVVNRVARLLSIGHGGQILMSGITGGLVRDLLPANVSLRDLGLHRLKDLERAERVYQLERAGERDRFPPLKSLQGLQHNLPEQTTSFVGRDDEVEDVTALVNDHRLVSLIGTGGVGKTRLSLQVAANLLDGLGDGIWFSELAQVGSGDVLVTTIATSVGLVVRGDDLLRSLVTHLRPLACLIVLDNCEHIVDDVARVAGAILRECPRVKLLASSRQPLLVTGEHVYRIPALGVPSKDALPTLTARAALGYDAVRLFVQRAAAVDRSFVLDDANAPIVADICITLDGIPLALELAAARVRVLRPGDLRRRLDERLRLLTGGYRTALPRHQTLRGLIDWSYELLPAPERTLFARIGTFTGSFTIEAAAAVCGDAEIDEFEILDLIGSLVDKSLVVLEADGAEHRYRLLESIREYARERLRALGESDRMADRHLAYFARFTKCVRERAEASGREADHAPSIHELDNVRMAIARSLEPGGDIVAGATIAAAMPWSSVDAFAEGRRHLETFAALLPDVERAVGASVWSFLAAAYGTAALHERELAAATRAVELARTLDDRAVLFFALRAYAAACAQTGNADRATVALTELEAIVRSDPKPGRRRRVLDVRATIAEFGDDLERAVAAYAELLAFERELGNEAGVIIASINLAESEHGLGRTERAVALAREAIDASERIRWYVLAMTLSANLAGYLADLGHDDEARVAARTTIRLAREDLESVAVVVALEHTALTFARRGEIVRGARLAGFTDAAFARLGFQREATEIRSRERLDASLHAQLAAPEIERLRAEGAALTAADAAAFAFPLESGTVMDSA